MSYGVRVWGADGALQLDETSFTMRQVLSVLVTLGGGNGNNVTYSVPGCTPDNCIAVLLPIGPYVTNDQFTVQFEPEILNGSVRVWAGHRTAVQGLFGAGTQRLIVSRFK